MALRAILMVTCSALAKGSTEGQAAVLLLAEEVKAWAVEKLPVPFEIEQDRDVGWLGALPFNDSFIAEWEPTSLDTERQAEGFPPNIIIGRTLVKGSRMPTIPPPSWRYKGPEAGGMEKKHLNGAKNPTAELTIMGWQDNVYSALKEPLEHWSKRAGNRNKLMIIHSSGDTLYGGCTETEILEKYEAIIAAAVSSGRPPSIVAAAEVSPFPSDLGWKYSRSDWAETRRIDTLNGLGIADDWASEFANCTDGPCGSTMKYQYAHSGFIMGPVDDLIDMFKDLDMYTGWTNRYINNYYLENPDKMTLDYGGILALTLNNMGKSGSPVASLKTSGLEKNVFLSRKKVPSSGVTGTPVCFVQGNGNGLSELKTMAESTIEHLGSAEPLTP